MSSAGRIATVFFVGSLLMQTAWILALPPFRGIDEFDHAFRAAAVAEGQWLPSNRDAVNGRGNLQPVPASLVPAAQPVCEMYEYTGPDNCQAVERVDGDTVLIATAAGRYHPAFYWLIGTASRPFDGAGALYAMRATTAILCAALLGSAAFGVAQWARSRWAYLGLLVAMTPVAVYSTSIAAPNGVEISAGVALWAALLGLSRSDLAPKRERLLLIVAIPAAMVISTVRQLGPLFLLLIVLTTMAVLGKEGVARCYSRHRGTLLLAGLVTFATSVANILWVRSAGALTPEPISGTIDNPALTTLSKAPLWMLQSIAAFPTRNEQAPTVVYASWLVVFTLLLLLAFWAGRGRIRTGLGLSLVIASATPLLLSLMTMSSAGPIWQGRYGLPYAVGVCLLAGRCLDIHWGTSFLHRFAGPVFAAMGTVMAIAHAVSVGNVSARENSNSPLSGDPTWIQVHPTIVLAFMSAGWLTLWLSSGVTRATQREPSAFGYHPSLGPSDTSDTEARY